jgi:hypothetical protein
VFGETRVPTGACHASRPQTSPSSSQEHAEIYEFKTKLIRNDQWSHLWATPIRLCINASTRLHLLWWSRGRNLYTSLGFTRIPSPALP